MHFTTMITSVLITFLVLITCNWPTTTAIRLCPGVNCYDCFQGFRSASCYWVEDYQECMGRDNDLDSSHTVVSQPTDCPVAVSVYEGRGVYRAYVANDVAGLLRFLDRVGVSCSRGGLADGYTTRVTVKGTGVGEVTCSSPQAYSQNDFGGGGGPFSFDIKRTPWRPIELSVVAFGPDRAWRNEVGTVLMAVTVRNWRKVDAWYRPVGASVVGRPCNIVNHPQDPQDEDMIWCEVSLSGLRAGKPGPVIVYFSSEKAALLDTSFAVRSMRNFRFDPIPEVGQRLSGIASGGTAFQIKWNDLTGVAADSVSFYVRPDGGRRLFTKCRVGATTLNCSAPVVGLLDARTAALAQLDCGVERELECGVELEFEGQRIDYPCERSAIEYRVHSDPKFTHFQPRRDGSAAIVIYGPALRDAGFGAEDMNVLLLDYYNMERVHCKVNVIAAESMECTPDYGDLSIFQKSIESLRIVNVTVGNAHPVLVRRS